MSRSTISINPDSHLMLLETLRLVALEIRYLYFAPVTFLIALSAVLSVLGLNY